jgi:hypothetical protein
LSNDLGTRRARPLAEIATVSHTSPIGGSSCRIHPTRTTLSSPQPARQQRKQPGRIWRRAPAISQKYASGDWSLIAPCFTEDASYVVSGSPGFGGTHEGGDAILANFAGVTAGLDKRFASREVIVLDGLEDRGDHAWMRWEAVYHLAGAPDFRMQGESFAYFDGLRMRRLEDRLPAETVDQVTAYMTEHGAKLG